MLNVIDFTPSLSDPGIRRLLRQRQGARAARDWDTADEIRDRLAAMGVVVRDGKA